MMKYIRKEEGFQIHNINSDLTKNKRERRRDFTPAKDEWKEMIKKITGKTNVNLRERNN